MLRDGFKTRDWEGVDVFGFSSSSARKDVSLVGCKRSALEMAQLLQSVPLLTCPPRQPWMGSG